VYSALRALGVEIAMTGVLVETLLDVGADDDVVEIPS
jgi:hypothetical protein